jgi:exosortase/archaeosortase family protein
MVLLGLFLSELSGLRGLKRFYPVLLGWVFAFTINIGRMTALALIVAKFGLSALASWHDAIGTTAFVLTGILLVGAALRPPKEEAPRRFGASPFRLSLKPCCIIPLGFLALFAGGELLNWWWYDTASAERRGPWTVRWSSLGEEARTVDISKQIFSALNCDSGSARWWFSADGHRWIGYCFEWKPGPRARFGGWGHAPEICLPASGRKLLRDNGYQRFFFGENALSVRHQVFDDFGQPLNVFFIMEESGISNSESPLDAASLRGRLKSVLTRSRQGDRRSLELIAEAYETPDAAWNNAQSLLRRVIVPNRQAQSSGHESDTAQNFSLLFRGFSF